MTRWRGVALGADATITLEHPEAEAIIARALAEIARLEAIFSLHHADSALTRLNAEGFLAAPPFELLDCLGLCGRVHAATGGAFDPSVQPLWALHAAHYAGSTRRDPPAATALAEALARTGWAGVRFDAGAIRLPPRMALTLNGIAQGYVTDSVAALLRGMGLDRVLVGTGEFAALGGDPRGGPWQIGLRAGDRVLSGRVALENGALASSAAQGITFDAAGLAGISSIRAPARPAPPRWQLISVTAPEAALADALSTAFCLLDRPAIDAALAAFPAAGLAALVA